jgi:BirA family biotin operon repressor/biotin-[acetyl-CoA-carboxylase] ligase
MKNLETLFIGQNLIHLQDVDSTNNFAANLIKQTKVVNGTVILAENQFQGRGQSGNKWESEEGKNLIISLILQPKIKAKNQFVLSKMTCLAIIETLQEYNISAKIKWPNDILIEKKKIAGILIENSLKGEYIGSSIIGIGLNVNQLFEPNSEATSVLNQTKKETDRNIFLKLLFQKLEKWYLKLEQDILLPIDDAYLKSLFALNESQTFQENNNKFKATVLGVNNIGQLIVKPESGKTRNFNNQEIKFILN